MKKKSSSKLRKFLCGFLSLLILFQTTACKNFFLVKNVSPGELISIYNAGKLYEYFVLHADTETYALSNIDTQASTLSGTVKDLDRSVFYSEYRKESYQKEEYSIINEVHIYLNPDFKIEKTGKVEITIEDIHEIRVIDKDKGRTVASYILGGIGIWIGAMALFAGIALISGSCPYAYSDNGEDLVFEGDIYTGAILQNMERDDYMPLPAIRPIKDEYRLRIANELQERQYTNLAQLVVANHAEGTKVLLDNKGIPHLIQSEISPESAIDYSGQNLKPVLEEKERMVYLFNDTNFNKCGVELSFPKPENAQSGNLLLNAKNTIWLDQVFESFSSKFGNKYNNWMEKREKDPPEERRQLFIDNGSPLSIWLKTVDGWKLVDHLNSVGPAISRDLLVPIDLSAVSGDKVQLKIETGFMYWELDYAAMDFTANENIELQMVNAHKAVSSDGGNPLPALAQSDDLYMEHLNVGDFVDLSYPVPACKEGQKQSVFLHSRGYYEPIRDYKGAPKIDELQKFKNKGYMMQYSRERYQQIAEEMLSLNK